MLTKKIVEKIQEEFVASTWNFLCEGSDTFEDFWLITYERNSIKKLAQKLIGRGVLNDATLSVNSSILFETKPRHSYERNIRLLFLEELLKSDLI